MIAQTDVSFGEVRVAVPVATSTPMNHAKTERSRNQHRDEELGRLVDRTLEDSFPASDPPSWTASVARPALEGTFPRSRA